MSTTTPTKMNYDQYCLLPEDGNQYELVHGVLIVTPSPNRQHQRILMALSAELYQFVIRNSLGEVYVAPLDTIFDQYTVVQPDILYICKERLPEVAKERIEGAPDLVVEILSPSTAQKDRKLKLAVYAEFGVREYWIVDPKTSTLEVYELTGGALRRVRTFAPGEMFECGLLSGFHFPVEQIF
jgi:Uma2 family endonuclease